ncbi:MAG: hypothetical protein JXQ83_03695 [Candidatus Glassbacteria bacterium]|nr:hypothetical protein [Candidatus Glassbacteria bacterium]
MHSTGQLKSLALLACFLVITGPASQAGAFEVNDDFADGDFANWTVDNPGAWEVADGVLQQKSAVSTSGSWLRYFARLDTARADGEFTLTVRLGFNPKAYPLSSATEIGGDIYRRSYAFGIMQDNNNALLATFHRSSGAANGILKISGGTAAMLYAPYTGQGMGLELHDIREMKISRSGRLVTVWLDGRVVYQADEAESTGALATGSAVVCSRGPAGLALDRIAFSSAAAAPPAWAGPQGRSDFLFELNEGSGHLLTSADGRHWGTVETGGSEPGSFMGWWVEEGAAAGVRSWAAAGGQLTVMDYTMGPQATLEGWFKFLDTGPDYGVPIFHLMFDGSLLNPDWGRERGGPVLVFSEGEARLHYHEFGWATAGDMGGIMLDQWTHIAWVRDGSLHSFYIDGEEVGSVEVPRYGETTLTGIQINVANNADHDWLRGLGSPYLYVDKICATAEALEPDEFKLVVSENGRPVCDINGDGRRNVVDVVALLLKARNDPDDPAVDINGDGVWLVADAVELLLRIMHGTCPDALN